MPKRDHGLGALAAAAVSSGSPDRNAAFIQRLRTQLGARAITLVGAELGRNVVGPVWVVTIQTPDAQIVVLHAPIAGNFDPLSAGVCDDVTQRVSEYVEQRATGSTV
jgi:hypothetical protein